MTVRLKELYEQALAQGHDIVLVTGSKGLERPVRWVHMVENEEIAGFLEGQEIAFTTGIGLKSQAGLKELVASAYHCGASGIVINLGPFIHSIGPDVIQFCKERDFPLFRVPWSEHMAQIMHQFSLDITMSEKHSIELAAALENAIFWPAREEMYMEYMEQDGFGKDWNYCVAVFDVCAVARGVATGAHVPDSRLDAFVRRIESLMTMRQWRSVVLTIEHRIVLVFARYAIDAAAAMVHEILALCVESLAENEQIFAGVGKVTHSARCIGKSYHQGLMLDRLQRHRGKPRDPLLYDEAGVDRLLLSIDDQEILEDYYINSIGPLIEYDRVNDGDLTQVLNNYLSSSGSIKETSERMFVHRNTVNYKISKIQDLLGVNLSDFSVRMELLIGLHVKELLDC